MMNGKANFYGDRLRAILNQLKALTVGFNTATGEFGGGGVDAMNDKLNDVKTKLDTLNISVKLDDPDIASTKTNTDTIVTDLTAVKADVAAVKSNTASIKTNTSNTKTSVDTVNTTLETVKTDTAALVTDISTIKADIATTKTNVTSIKTNTANTKTSVDTVNTNVLSIYTLLNDRLLNRVVISRADYDALVTKDPNTLYYVIESQSNS